jgi:hypothetical protein
MGRNSLCNPNYGVLSHIGDLAREVYQEVLDIGWRSKIKFGSHKNIENACL